MESSEFDLSRPELREAAETLEQALTEACASRSAHEADTGELIRVEEMLALATDAARRAISIRRKARLQTDAADVVPVTGSAEGPVEGSLDSARESAADAEPSDQLSLATHRLFDDGRGVRWDVWAVYPEGRPSQLSALPGSYQTGWLVFESATEKRRLSPIPSGWLTLPTVALQQLCEQAAIALQRSRPRRAGEDTPAPTE